MVIIVSKNIVNSKYIPTIDGIRKMCPFKEGDTILIESIYYKILITDSKKKNNKLFNKLKRHIPEKWHPFVDFIV